MDQPTKNKTKQNTNKQLTKVRLAMSICIEDHNQRFGQLSYN
jgi:hypothetical protein